MLMFLHNRVDGCYNSP